MRLREVINSPDRYDEVVLMTKSDSTKPPYPELLASQTIPFNPNNTQAAFPSLPLIGKNEADKEGEQAYRPSLPTTSVDGSNLRTLNESDCTILPRVKGTRTSIDGQKGNEEDGEEVNNHTDVAKRAVKDTCDQCHKICIRWDSLSLAVQSHIFNFFLRHQKCVKVVATTLELTTEEFHTIMHQRNLRRIYQTPLETARAHGVIGGKLGPNIIDPEKIDDIMDYLLFASHYELATESEIKRGRRFLKQLGFDDAMMDLFEDYEEGVGTYSFVEEREPRSSLKRRRNSTTDSLTILPSKPKAICTEPRAPASAPADITSFRSKVDRECVLLTPSEKQFALRNIRSSTNPKENTENQIGSKSRGTHSDIDNIGFASMGRGLNVILPIISRPTQGSGIAISRDAVIHPSPIQQPLSAIGNNISEDAASRMPTQSGMQTATSVNPTVQRHTIDVTVGNFDVSPLTQLNPDIQPESGGHKPFDLKATELQTKVASIDHYNDQQQKISAKVLRNTNVLSTNDIQGSFMKAPSYSPISEQDPESIPAWARHNKDSGDKQDSTPQLQTKPSNTYTLPLGRPAGNSIQNNHFMQGILNAAAENVLVPSTTSSSESTQTNSLMSGEAQQTSNAFNQDMHRSPLPLQTSPLHHGVRYVLTKKPRKSGCKTGRREKKSPGAVAVANVSSAVPAPAPVQVASGAADDRYDTKLGDNVDDIMAETVQKR